MGVDLHIKLFKKGSDETEYHPLVLYNCVNKEKNIYKEIDPNMGNRNTELFDLLEKDLELKTTCYNTKTFLEITSFNKELVESGYGFRSLTLADLKLALFTVPWEKEEKKLLKTFINEIESYLNFADPYLFYNPLSTIYIFYFFDH